MRGDAAAPASHSAPRSGDSIVSQLRHVCRDAATQLDARGVGLSVLAVAGSPALLVASDPQIERLEELPFTLGEGPWIDVQAGNRPVLIPDLSDGVMQRWPVYAPAASAAGIRAVFAVPMQIGAARLGVLEVFRTRTGALSRDELGWTFTYAAQAVSILLDAHQQAAKQPDGLDSAFEHRAAVLHAQGMVMVQLRVTLTEALIRIRAHAFAEDRPIVEVAEDIVARRLRLDQDRS